MIHRERRNEPATNEEDGGGGEKRLGLLAKVRGLMHARDEEKGSREPV